MEEKCPFAFKKVMVIDDNPIEHFLIDRLMNDQYFARSIVQCTDARVALEYLKLHESVQTELPQLIFLDINMEGMNGHEFMKAFDELHFIKECCRVVIFSSSVMEEDKLAFQQHDAVIAYVEKPLTAEKLEWFKAKIL